MDREDRERLVRIETILTESISPRINDHGKRIKVLEGIAKTATVIGAIGLGVVYMARDVAIGWLKKSVGGGN